MFGTLGGRPIDTITSADLLAIIGPLWAERRETARKLLARLRAVIRHALAAGHLSADPLTAVAAALPKNGANTRHFEALPASEVGDAIRTVQASGAHWAAKSCFEFVALTGARSGEARGARWSEVDTAARLWTVPGERTKTSKSLRVPLSGRAVEILADAAQRSGGDPTGLVFPSKSGRVLTSEGLSKLVRELGVPGTVHGMRATLRSWAAEQNIPREVAEAMLGHSVRGVEGAYQRSDVLEIRRTALENWAAFVGR